MEESPRRILVVDDEEVSRTAMVGILKRLGYQVSFAGDGPSAMDRVVKTNEEGDPFDLLILDILMPGMRGDELFAQLAERDIHIPAIAVTAYGDKDLVVDLLEKGFIGYLDKPSSTRNLQNYLKAVFNRIDHARRQALKEAEQAAQAQIIKDLEVVLGEVNELLSQRPERIEPQYGLDFSRLLRFMRERHGLTIIALAKNTELPAVRLHAYEANPSVLPPWPDLKKLADQYRLPISALVLLAENPTALADSDAAEWALRNLAAAMEALPTSPPQPDETATR